MAFASEKAIRFHHCDPAGIVFYPQYFVLMNELVEDWFELKLGLSFADLHQRDRLGVPMGRIECDFLAPSRIGDRLAFELVVERLGDASFRLDVAARSGGEVRLRAKLTLVLASLDTRRAVPIPAELRERMARDLAT
jgi:4-hydroxybenzoyl-CoA thioesterase